jgi:phosphoribosylamine---glycine ligase
LIGIALEPKKILFVTITGLLADIAWQATKEGNQVKFYIEDEEDKQVGDGFVEKVDNYEEWLDWADVIVFDDTLGHGDKAAALREKGHKVIGGTPYTDRLEDERSFGQEELRKHGINIIPRKDFTDLLEAAQYVRDNPGRYVIKPSGHAGSVKNLIFVGEEDDGKDVVQVLEDYHRAQAKIPAFQLQKRVTGVEIAVGAFFNGKVFITPINVNFEHKKLFPGELGPQTGDMANTMFWSGPNRIFNQTLKKMEARFAEEGYVGYMDINCIVNGNGIYPLEFTARFGYPTISIQQEGMNMPVGEFLYNLASGEEFNFKTKSGFQIGVRIVVPPFPYDDPDTFKVKSLGSVIHFKKPNREGVHIEDVKQVNGEWVVTGSSGVVLIVCGTGATMKEAQRQCYNRIKNIMIPNMYYRDDIGERWFEDSDRLHNWGYLREL